MSQAEEIAFNYVSHLPILAAAFRASRGAVLELGAGIGSTLALHGLCGASGRRLVTLESDAGWVGRFQSYAREWHEIRKVDGFIDLPEYGQDWGMAFIDHGSCIHRGDSALALKHVPLVVIHDSELPWMYGYEKALEEFRYRWDYTVQGPYTTVLSMTSTLKFFDKYGL